MSYDWFFVNFSVGDEEFCYRLYFCFREVQWVEIPYAMQFIFSVQYLEEKITPNFDVERV